MVSNSLLSDLAKSPFHCWALNFAPNRPERTETASMKAGTLAHCLILEPDTVTERYVVQPLDLDPRTKAGKEWTAAQSRVIVTGEQMKTAEEQRAAVMAVPELASILTMPGVAESSVFWTDQETGLSCMCRPDWLVDGPEVICLDLKTSADAMPDGFGKSCASFGYHRQAAHYSNGLRANGLEVDLFVFAVVSSAYPFIAAPYVLDADSYAQGEEEIAELMTLFKQCKDTEKWPAFGDGYQVASLPRWARREIGSEIAYV